MGVKLSLATSDQRKRHLDMYLTKSRVNFLIEALEFQRIRDQRYYELQALLKNLQTTNDRRPFIKGLTVLRLEYLCAAVLYFRRHHHTRKTICNNMLRNLCKGDF